MAWRGGFGAVAAALATFTSGEGPVVADFAAWVFGAPTADATGTGMAAGTAWPPFKIPFGSVATTCSVVTEAGARAGASAAVVPSSGLGVAA